MAADQEKPEDDTLLIIGVSHAARASGLVGPDVCRPDRQSRVGPLPIGPDTTDRLSLNSSQFLSGRKKSGTSSGSSSSGKSGSGI
jgi:hypothetical protein